MTPSKITRRDFLRTIAVAGGATAAWATLDAWGLARPVRQERPPLEGNGEGVRLIILGSGLGGLTAAYELSRQGYDIQILEARNRAGGRNWTVRRGTELTELGGEPQMCEFDEGLYANLGPWRLPHHHEAVLYYCRELNVPVEAFINYQEANYVYVEGEFGPLSGQVLRQRQLKADMGGYTAELLAKFGQDGQLGSDLTAENIQQLTDYLVNEGLIDADSLTYTGTGRRGYAPPPGAGMQPGQPLPPVAFDELLPYAAEIQREQGYYLGSVAGFSQQMTMLQPIGGMDRIGQAFVENLGDIITYQAEVQEIRQDEDGVRIVYEDLSSGETREISGDYCLCNIPLPVLNNIPADLEPDMAEAISRINYASTGKCALQFSRRFWEEDDRIFGGVTRTNVPTIGSIAYPSYGYLSSKGVVQGYYNFDNAAIEISALSPQERIDHALEYGRKIHPPYGDAFETGFSVAWHRVPYSQGGWASYTEDTRQTYYPRLLEPDGRIYLVGEHLSYLTGWQEGAIRSAWTQLEKLHQRVMQS